MDTITNRIERRYTIHCALCADFLWLKLNHKNSLVNSETLPLNKFTIISPFVQTLKLDTLQLCRFKRIFLQNGKNLNKSILKHYFELTSEKNNSNFDENDDDEAKSEIKKK